MSNKYEDLIKNARVNAECGEHMSPAEVTTLLNVFETTFAALAAENAGLKQFPDQIVSFIGKLGSSEIGRDTKEKIEFAANKVKTPATDAFLAEVRAQGVEMFAAHKRERQQALRSRSMRMSEEAAGMAADAENFADELRKGVQS
ncbi:hypothetical protein MZD66_13825 [Escherichia coli]|uniref:hypothetical protein n=1 Tax=Escherichia coli TaxID=562 RepID=UPI000693DFF9|nr:hypothetical protein [Escherichia coli]EAO9224037.1 hypothetical protein [Salmonella enterica]EAY9846115.1 hypothetical protein [Salmonella enterica subsp. enterica serovar Johannesburg]ECH7858757.1 hypothetical protein [Salmonella enterica subsp. enterica serovar Brandenburg]EEB2074505.1 hypothetical protein [Salmonella enterica subsp. enterica]EEZ9775831.1 hypothetical protein [Escherichia coli O25]